MLNLLIAILLSLGCDVQIGASEADIQDQHSIEYAKAKEIAEHGNYKFQDGGGVVIVEIGGD